MTIRQAFTSSLVTILVAGCADREPDEVTASATAAIENGPCHVPEELDRIDQGPWFCSINVDCPCGSRCEQGLCTYDCRSDGDCAAGLECDELGACSTPGEIPPPPPGDRLVVSPDLLAFTERDVPRRMEITAQSAVASATVSMPDGLEVECDPTSSGTGGPACDCTTAPCALDGFDAGDTAVLWVRVSAAGTLPDPASWELVVTSENRVVTVPVELIEATTALDGVAGHYAGTARLAQSSIFGAGTGAAIDDHRIAVTADVEDQGSGVYRVALRASNRMIGVTGVAVGALTCQEPVRGCWLSIASADQVDSADRRAPLLSGAGMMDEVEGGVIRGTLPLQAYGTMSRSNSPELRWELTLQRTSEPGQSVPVAQTGHSLPTVEDMPPWEKAVVMATSQVGHVPICYGDLIFGYCVDWLREAYHRHANALMSSTSTAQCEWHGTYPAEFIPCKSNDHPWGPDVCSEFSGYGCTVGTWTSPEGKIISGCWLSPPSTVQVPDEDKALTCSQRYLCSHTPTLEELEEQGLPVDTILQLGGDAFTIAPMINGDLKCGPTAEGPVGAYIPDTIGLFTNADRGAPLAVSEMMGACLTDLRARPSEDMTVPDMFYSEGCINRARFERAVGWASRDARDRMTTFPTPVPTDEQEAADALFLRLLQQWIEVHMFVAREGTQQAVLAEVLATDTDDPEYVNASAKPQIVEVLQVMEAGWSQLLHPRWADPLGMVTGKVLAEPDYRARPFSPEVWGEEWRVPTRPEDQQKVGLPVTLLEGMTAYLEVLARHLESAGLSGSPIDRTDALAYLGPAMRHAALTDAIASGLYDRARASGVGWADQYEIARGEMGVAWARAAGLGLSLADGTNPLGIEDEDLPLYFGDPVGTTAEFFAASLYTLDIADGAIAATSLPLRDARAAWSAWQSQSWQDRIGTLNQGTRIVDAKERHGRAVQELCGAREGLPSQSVLHWIDASPRDGVPDVPAEVCYIDRSDPTCQTIPAEIDAVLDAASEDDVRYGLCLAHKNWQAWRTFRDYWGGPADPSDLDRLLEALASGEYGIPFAIAGDVITFEHDQEEFEVDRAALLTGGSFRADDVAECAQQFPNGKSVALGALPSSPARNPACYHGRLGELAVGIQAAGKRIEIARQEMFEHIEHYQLGTEACIVQAEIHDDMSTARTQHENAMRGLRSARRDAQYTFSIVSAFVGFFSSAVSLLASEGSSGGGGIISNWAYMAGLHELETNVHVLNDRMADATLHHNNMMADLQGRIADLACFASAEQHLVGVKAASLRYQEAWIEATRAIVQFNNGKSEVELAVRDGFAAVDRESAPLPVLAHEHWLDEHLENFDRSMRWARRTTYLAARAVEYETQQSLALTEEVLRARHPDELDAIHLDLLAEVLPRGLGARPSQMPMVVSLCSYLRSLEDEMPTTQVCDPNWFRRYLTDPAFARYDEDTGEYEGQMIPFTLRPYGIHREDDCAERIWSVSTSIIGAGVNFTGTPTVRVDLMKSNTFASQWCVARPQGEPEFQIASTRPCRNLFLEAGPISPQSPPASCSEDGWAKARITARFDTPQGFYDNTDYQPSTDELAGRGLYGDYALYIPASVIRHGSQTSGIAVENIEDVLLRFSYNSVAR